MFTLIIPGADNALRVLNVINVARADREFRYVFHLDSDRVADGNVRAGLSASKKLARKKLAADLPATCRSHGSWRAGQIPFTPLFQNVKNLKVWFR